MAKDTFGNRDSLQATVSVPEGEEHLVAGLAPQDDSPPTEPKPPEVVTEVRQTDKGFGVYVDSQHAPLTLANVTWHSSQESADAAVKKMHEDFGWRWVAPQYDDSYEEQEDPNRPGETRTVRVRGKTLVAEGHWAGDYHLLFDPQTHAELMEATK